MAETWVSHRSMIHLDFMFWSCISLMKTWTSFKHDVVLKDKYTCIPFEIVARGMEMNAWVSVSSPLQSWALDEDQTLLLVTRWVHHNPSSRERNLRSLLTWVQWCRLNPQTAIKLMQTHPLYSNSNSLLALFFLLDALNDNQLLPSDFLAPFYKLKAKFCQVRWFLLYVSVWCSLQLC